MKILTKDGTAYLVDKIREVVLNSRAGKMNRKIIFIGDSYGTGLNPDGGSNIENWVDLTASRMGLSSSDYYNWSVSGASFLSQSSTGLVWNNIINTRYSEVSDISRTITDVVIGGGINDANIMHNGQGRSMTSTLVTAITDTLNNIKLKFPNAKRWIAPFGWCRGVHNRRDIMANNVFYAHSKGAIDTGSIYVESAEYVLHNYGLFASDYYHPNINGENAIADIMSSALLMGHPRSISTLSKNGNNTSFLYANANFVKTNSSITINNGEGMNVLTYMDGKTCFLFSNLTMLSGVFNCGGSTFTLGTVSAGHIAGTHFAGTAPLSGAKVAPAFISPCMVKKQNANVFNIGMFVIWFEEPTNTPATGGTVNLQAQCYAIDPTLTGTNVYMSNAERIFSLNFENCSIPAALC